MGETAYFENLLREQSAAGDLPGSQSTYQAGAWAGQQEQPWGATSAIPEKKNVVDFQQYGKTPLGKPVTGAGFPKAQVSHLEQAANIYNQIPGAPSDMSPQISVGTPPPQEFASGMDTWRYGSPADARRADAYSRGGGGYGGGPAPLGPSPELDLSGITLDLPDYAPPEEDEGIKTAAREKAYQRGRGDIAEQTHNAIISAKSLDNPAARGQFVGDVLRSMGSGLTQISAAAGREADQVAARKRAEQLNIYSAKYQAQSTEVMAAYNQELQEAMANFGQEQAAWSAGGSGAPSGGYVSGLRPGYNSPDRTTAPTYEELMKRKEELGY